MKFYVKSRSQEELFVTYIFFGSILSNVDAKEIDLEKYFLDKQIDKVNKSM